MGGFQKFLLRGNIVELAIGLTMGVAFGATVTAFVENLITPLIGIFGGIPDFSALSFSVNGSIFKIGLFINALLAFIIIAAIVYFFVVMPMMRLLDIQQRQEAANPAEKDCPECLSRIPVMARKCKFCASTVA